MSEKIKSFASQYGIGLGVAVVVIVIMSAMTLRSFLKQEPPPDLTGVSYPYELRVKTSSGTRVFHPKEEPTLINGVLRFQDVSGEMVAIDGLPLPHRKPEPVPEPQPVPAVLPPSVAHASPSFTTNRAVANAKRATPTVGIVVDP